MHSPRFVSPMHAIDDNVARWKPKAQRSHSRNREKKYDIRTTVCRIRSSL